MKTRVDIRNEMTLCSTGTKNLFIYLFISKWKTVYFLLFARSMIFHESLHLFPWSGNRKRLGFKCSEEKYDSEMGYFQFENLKNQETPQHIRRKIKSSIDMETRQL